MNFEKVSTKYSVTVPLEDFEALIEFESPWQDACRADKTLYAKLRDMGIESDYDGHYSSIIHIEIYSEDDGDKFQAEISNVIDEQLKIAIKWKTSLDI